MINYNHLYYFHVTATAGTVAKAAEQLGVGQPTVSEQVRQLERSLGLPLFERKGGKLKLTEAGRNAYEHTSVMFRAGERLVQSLVGNRTPPPLQLRVGISTTVARTVATDFLMPVLAIEDCIPTIRTASASELLNDLCSHDLDLVLSESDPGEAHRPGIQLVTVQQPRLVAITSGEVSDERWEGVSLVHYRPGSAYRFPIDNYLDEHDLRPRISAEADDPMLMMASVLRGFAAFVPWSIAREYVAAKKVRVIARVSPENASVNAMYHDAEHAKIARRAVELLVDCARTAEAE